jgi:hypothetical protein
MQSSLEAQCQMCGQKINIGDEIVRVANGIWIHDYCKDKSPEENNNQDNTQQVNKKLLDSKADRLKSLKCVYCENGTFMKSKLETVALDDGTIITKKLYPCYTCGHIMEFIQNITS